MEKLAWSTEQRNPRTMLIDRLDSPELVNLIVSEDAAVHPAVQRVSVQLAELVELAVAAIEDGGCVHVLGAGTSGRLAVLDAAELYPTYGVGPTSWAGHLAGGEQAMFHAVEGAEDDVQAGAELVAGFGPADLVIGVAASGRTPFVGGALAAARDRARPTGLISSNPNAPLAGLADVSVLPDTGPEVVTGSTRMKAGTAQKIILNTLSTATMVRLGHTYSNLMVDVVASNEKLAQRKVQILQEATGRPVEACQAALADTAGNVREAVQLLLAI